MAEKKKDERPKTRGEAIDAAVRERNIAMEAGAADRDVGMSRGVATRNTGLSPRSTPAGGGAAPKQGAKPTISGKGATGVVVGATGRIESAPAFLGPLAKQINKIRDQSQNVKGVGGVKVTTSKANAIVDASPIQSQITALESEMYVEGSSVSVPGTTGTLKGVVAHSGGHPGGYPTVLQTVDGNVTTKMYSSGVDVQHTTGANHGYLAYGEVGVGSGLFTFAVNANTGTIVFTNVATSKSLTIDASLITQNMTVREIDVCDAGVPKKMLIVGSAPYV